MATLALTPRTLVRNPLITNVIKGAGPIRPEVLVILAQVKSSARARVRVRVKMTVPPRFCTGLLTGGLRRGTWWGIGDNDLSRLTCREQGLVHEGIVTAQGGCCRELPAAA